MAENKNRTKETESYVDNNEMIEELKHYKETGEITDKLGVMFREIANRYTLKLYSQYQFPFKLVEDIVSSCVERMIKKIDKFDTERKNSNPFAYFTQTAHNQVIAFLKKERRNYNIIEEFKQRYWQDIAEHYELENTETYENHHHSDNE